MSQNLVLERGTPGFETWAEMPADVFMSVRVFDIINSDELSSNRSSRPRLVEHGPYTWVQDRPRDDIVEVPENSTISYRQRRVFTRYQLIAISASIHHLICPSSERKTLHVSLQVRA